MKWVGATPRRLSTAVVVLLAAGCGSSGVLGRAGETPPPLAACPVGEGAPIVGVERTTLPCLAAPEQQVSVAAVHGRAEVINVWASWCSPCRREAALLEAAHLAAGDRILFLGINTKDTRAAALEFLTASDVTYPQVVDSTGMFASRLRSPGLPYTLVVDASGRIVYRWIGELTPERLQYGLSRLDPARAKVSSATPGVDSSPLLGAQRLAPSGQLTTLSSTTSLDTTNSAATNDVGEVVGVGGS